MTRNQSQALEVQLRVPRESYSVREPIEVTLVLKNQTDAPITINKRMAINPGQMGEGSWEVKFAVVFPPGERLIRGALINRGKPHQEHFTVLPPGGEYSRTHILTRYFWMELPGAYEVKAIYHNSVDGSQFGLSAWTGEITSDPIYLRVTD